MKNSLKQFPRYTTVEATPKTICSKFTESIFNYPFLDNGIQINNRKAKSPTNFKRLNEISLSQNELLPLHGFIFHTSHCGSTLLVRMLQTHSQVRVISETEAINGLLLAYTLHQLPKAVIQEQLKKIIKTYCQPLENHQYVIFKLTSWNIFMIDLFLDLYPTTKWMYIDRDTNEVVRSLMKSDGGFARWWDHPTDFLRKQFTGIYTETTKEAYLSHMVSQHRNHAAIFQNQHKLSLNYKHLIEQFKNVTTHFNIDFSSKQLEAAKEVTAFYSKSMTKINFTQDTSPP